MVDAIVAKKESIDKLGNPTNSTTDIAKASMASTPNKTQSQA